MYCTCTDAFILDPTKKNKKPKPKPKRNTTFVPHFVSRGPAPSANQSSGPDSRVALIDD